MTSSKLSLTLILAVLGAIAGQAPVHAGLDAVALPGLRLTGGAVWHLDPERDAVGALDVLANVQFLSFEGDFTVTALMGYGFEGGGDTHLFLAGVDFGALLDDTVGVTAGLRGALGSSDGEFGGGMRAVIGLDLWYGVFRVEAGYQLLDSDRGTEHDLRVAAGVDLLRLVIAPLLALASDF